MDPDKGSVWIQHCIGCCPAREEEWRRDGEGGKGLPNDVHQISRTQKKKSPTEP